MKYFYFVLTLLLSCIFTIAQTPTHSKVATPQKDASVVSNSENPAKSANIKQTCGSWLNEIHLKNDLEKAAPEQLLQYMQKLGDCILNDETLTREDWQTAVLLNGDFNSIFYKKMGNSDMNATLKVGMDIAKDCVQDYNKLAVKYNDLVDLTQKQHDLLVRLSTTQISLPAPPSHIHCTAIRVGIMTDIDCN